MRFYCFILITDILRKYDVNSPEKIIFKERWKKQYFTVWKKYQHKIHYFSIDYYEFSFYRRILDIKVYKKICEAYLKNEHSILLIFLYAYFQCMLFSQKQENSLNIYK